MAKKLKIYERILLGLSFCADTLIDLHRAGSRQPRGYGAYYDPWSEDRHQSRLRQTYYRLLKTGHLEKIIKDGKPYLRLTSKAREKLKRDFPILNLQRKNWDGKWRLVIFDISEQERYVRDNLRKKLKELGFARFQLSTYISPFDFNKDLHEFLSGKNLLDRVFILTAKHELMGDPQELAERLWHLEGLDQEYDDLWIRIKTLKDNKDKKAEIKEIKKQYLNLIQKDPFLPGSLLPFDWMGEQVRKEMMRFF